MQLHIHSNQPDACRALSLIKRTVTSSCIVLLGLGVPHVRDRSHRLPLPFSGQAVYQELVVEGEAVAGFVCPIQNDALLVRNPRFTFVTDHELDLLTYVCRILNNWIKRPDSQLLVDIRLDLSHYHCMTVNVCAVYCEPRDPRR